MVRTFLKVYMELGSSFLFLQEQIKDIIINKQAEDYFAALGYQPHRQAPSGWHVLRLWRCVAPPPPRVATSLPLSCLLLRRKKKIIFFYL
jgi:hypothetical protein